MIRYHLNLKSAIPVASRRAALAIFLVVAICCNTLKINAELPPKFYILPIGNEQTPGGPKIKHYDPSPMGNVIDDSRALYSSDNQVWDSVNTSSIGDGSGTWVEGRVSEENKWLNTYPHPPTNAIPCQFPPIIESSNSVAMVVYKKEELGLNGLATTLSKLRLNALYARKNNNPIYDNPYYIWILLMWYEWGGNDEDGFTWDLTEWGGNNTEGYLPYNVTNEIGWYHSRAIQTGDWIGQVGDPTPVQIYIKNGAEFTERGEQDIDKAFLQSHGWTKVYDGYYDYLDEEQWDSYTPYAKIASTYVQDQHVAMERFGRSMAWGAVEPWGEAVDVNGRDATRYHTYSTDEASSTKGFNVTIPFEQKFQYEGGDITVAFVNPSEARGMKSDVWRGRLASIFQAGAILRPNNPIDLPTTYRFRCYTVADSDQVVSGDYLGPKFSIGSQVYPMYTTVGTDPVTGEPVLNPTEPYPYFGLNASYGDLLGSSYNSIWASNEEYVGESAGNVTNWNANKLTYSVPLTSIFLRSETEEHLSDGPGSVRPRIGLDIEVQALVTDKFTNGADFKNSEQILWNADRTQNDTQWVVGEFTVFADSSDFPLSLKRINFNTAQTSATLMPKIVLYRDISRNGTGDMTTSEKVAEIYPSGAENQVLEITEACTVKPGENRFFFVFEIEKAKARCDEKMELELTDFVLGNRVRFDTDKEYQVEVGNIAERSIAFNPVNIINTNNDSRYRQICISDANLEDITLDAGTVAGRYTSFTWEVSYNHGAYTALAGASAESTTATVSATENITSVRFKVIYPEEGCLATLDTVVWTIAYETDIEAVDFEYTGKLPHTLSGLTNGVYQGEFLEFKASSLHSPITYPVYKWEVSSDRTNWTVIGSQEILDYIVPLGSFGQQYIRVTATPDPELCACSKPIVSTKEFSFTVIPQEMGFTFIDNLPGYQSICQGAQVKLSVSYEGTVDPANCYWTKDGQPLTARDREYTITGGANTWGTYQYVVRALTFNPAGGDTEPTWRNVYSKPCVVSAVPALKIYYHAAQNNYALPGIPVALLFETTPVKMDSPNGGGYQWYKFSPGKGDVALEDNDVYRFGSTSNQLVLMPPVGMTSSMAKDVFTFNGEYYYLVITNACTSLSTKSRPIYVLPSEGLKFTKEVVDAVVCKIGDKATWEVETNEGNEITNVRYQWYVGGKAVSDGDGITGAKSSVLTIDPVPASDTKVYCVATAEVVGIPATIKSITVGVVTTEFRNLISSHAIDNTALTLDLKWETNNLSSTHTVNVTLNDSAWVEEVQPATPFKEKTMQLVIPIDDAFKALVAENPNTLRVLIEVKNDCGNVLSNRATVSLAGLDIETIAPPPAGIEDNATGLAFDILPNPVNDVVTVGFAADTEAKTTVELCDLSGQSITILFSGTCQTGYNKLNFDLTDLRLSSGTYLIRINSDKGTNTKQFVFAK